MKLLHGLALLLPLLLLPACASSPKPDRPAPMTDERPTTGFLFGDTGPGERSLEYALYVPRGYTPERRWPLVVFLHGRGESGADGHKQIIQGLGRDLLWNAARWPCLVLFPQKPDPARQWEDYQPTLLALVDDVQRRYAVDENRVAITGLSQGGHGAWAIAAAHPDRWSAVAPVCGYARPLKPEAIAQALRSTPVWAFHGEKDDVVPASQSVVVVESLRTVGADVRFSLYPGVNHNAWDRAYAEKDLPAFLLQPRRKR